MLAIFCKVIAMEDSRGWNETLSPCSSFISFWLDTWHDKTIPRVFRVPPPINDTCFPSFSRETRGRRRSLSLSLIRDNKFRLSELALTRIVYHPPLHGGSVGWNKSPLPRYGFLPDPYPVPDAIAEKWIPQMDGIRSQWGRKRDQCCVYSFVPLLMTSCWISYANGMTARIKDSLSYDYVFLFLVG